MTTIEQTRPLSKVAAAFGHEFRIEILQVLSAAEGALSPVVIADLLDRPVNSTSYHVRQLADAGLIRLTSTRPRRGAVEHFYTAAAGVERALALLREAEDALE